MLERDRVRIPLDQHVKHQRKSRKAATHIQTALEASCGALIMLESIRACAGEGTIEDVRRPIQQAIDSLRQAVDELRSASDDGTRLLPYEFVLRAGVPGLGVSVPYTSPRRTA